jgi:hypothetical protein
MQAIGHAESWFSEISNFAAIVCLLNATGIYFLMKKHRLNQFYEFEF